MENINPPILSKRIFWDTDYNKIDWIKNEKWVICRVLDRGSTEDWEEIKRYYGIDKILESAKTARYLSKKAVYSISNNFNVPLEEFRVYRLLKDKPNDWIY